MKTSNAIVVVLALLAVGAGSYWAGSRTRAAAPGMPQADSSVASAPVTAAAKPRKLLHYRNPMGLADTSPVPKKDQMGMDYIAVYEGEDEAGGDANTTGQIRISTEKVQKLGVRAEAAALRPLGRSIRASARIEADERRIAVVTPKFEGYVDKLLVNTNGQYVAQGQVLFEAYSPDLVSAQREYLIAAQGLRSLPDASLEAQGGMRQLAEASLAHLRHWDLSPTQIETLVKTGQPQRNTRFVSPVSGYVTEKKAVQGMRFMPGEMLYQITDLSSVWVLADVAEQDLALVKLGAKASVRINAYPEQALAGTITYIYPTLKAETRTVPVRIELANPRGLLKPAMLAQVEMQVGSAAAVLSVPESAVIDTGTRRMVLVQLKEGRFEPREVQIGARSDNYVEVLEGVREGELVVVAANFLIDAESNLKAVTSGMGEAASAPAATASTAPAARSVSHKAHGTVDSIDAKAGTVTLNHDPVASLKWPAMTMDFTLANPALIQGLKPGAAINFEFVERGAGEWVITGISPAKPAAAPAQPAAKAHSGH